MAFAVDLEFEVDGVRGRLVDDGPALVVHTDQPIRLLRAVADGAGTFPRDRAGITALLDRLPPGAPRQIVLRGPRGVVATLGHTPGGAGVPGRLTVRPSGSTVRRVAISAVAVALVVAAVLRFDHGPDRS